MEKKWVPPKRRGRVVAALVLVFLAGALAAAIAVLPSSSRGDGSPRSAPSPPIAITSVSCVRSTWCMAVGYLVGQNTSVTEVWSGARWHVEPFVRGLTWSSVRCLPSGECVRLGGSDTGRLPQNVESRCMWRSCGSTSVIPDSNVWWCGSTSGSPTATPDCVVAGLDEGGYLRVFRSDSGGGWKRVPLPRESLYPAFLTCASKGRCIVVGSQRLVRKHGYYDMPAWLTVGSRTSLQQLPALRGLLINGVSCPTRLLCFAVASGIRGLHGNLHDFTDILSSTGVKWRLIKSIPDLYLEAVSCAGATKCVAVGTRYPDRSVPEEMGLAAIVWNGVSWSELPVPRTLGSVQLVGLRSVSCVGSSCVATGVGADGEALAVQWHDRTLVPYWHPLQAR